MVFLGHRWPVSAVSFRPLALLRNQEPYFAPRRTIVVFGPIRESRCDGSGASRLDARRCHGYSRGRPLLPPSSRHPKLHRDWIWFQMGTRLPGDPAGFVAESRTRARPEHRRPSLCPLVSDFQGPSSDLHLRRELQGQEDLALREQQERGSIRTHSFADRFQRLRGCRRLAGRSGTWNSGSRRSPQGPGRARSFRAYSTGHLSLPDLLWRITRK